LTKYYNVRHLSACPAPTRALVISDRSSVFSHPRFDSSPSCFPAIHHGKDNLAWLDGHVDSDRTQTWPFGEEMWWVSTYKDLEGWQ